MSGGGIFHAGTGAFINVTMSGTFRWRNLEFKCQSDGEDTLINKGANGTNCAGFYIGGSNNLSNDNTCGFGAGDGVQNLLLGPLVEIRPTNSKNAKSKGNAVVVDAFTGPFTALP
jgi:hypothetical protein